MESSKTNQSDGNNITTLSHHPYILCHFANYAHHKTLYMHFAYSYSLNQQGIQHCSLQSSMAMFSSNKILQHNLNSNIPYRPSTAHALNSFCIQSRWTISALLRMVTTMQQPTTKLTLHAHQHALHTQHYPPHCLPQPSTACSYNKHKVNFV